MCIFSQPVETVSDTSIFARLTKSSQYLVYQMTYTSHEDLAMVLPIPVARNLPENAVRFINLDGYRTFFDDLAAGIAESACLSVDDSVPPRLQSTLTVHDVGDFNASFVPTLPDFKRLDHQFTLGDEIWAKLPMYHDYGFAVFKLKPKLQAKVHPMAFEFPTRTPGVLYFPTIHIHDNDLREKSHFDHTLYCQIKRTRQLASWERSSDWASRFVNIGRSLGIVDGQRYCWSRRLLGMLANKDTFVGESDMC